MKNAKFYICPICGNLVEMVADAGIKPFCCGKKMDLLEPNTVEASGEKHIPVVRVEGDKVVVDVGSVAHTMVEEHFIQWIQLVTDNGSQRQVLTPGQAPQVTFLLGQAKPLAVYAYCNLHGLWMTEI